MVNDTRGGAFAGIAPKGHGRPAMLASIARDARLTRGYVLQIVLSTAIAHLGLLMNSSPVVIGAMLISPLLAPIMAFGFALATLDGRLLRRSLQTLAVGTVVGIAVAALITMLSPITDATPAILARVRPSLLDLMVAMFGGIAGAYALLRRFSATLVGVAIATALIPPLATVGWALVVGRTGDAAGAMLLFVTNTATIGFMATLVARINRFGIDLSPKHTWLQIAGIIAALALLSVPLGFSLSAIVYEARASADLREKLTKLTGPSALIDRFEIDFQSSNPSVSAVVVSPDYIPKLETRFAASARSQLGSKARISVIQLRSGSAAAENLRTAEADAARERALAEGEARQIRAALTATFDGRTPDILVDAGRRRALVTLAAPEDEGDPGEEPIANAPLSALRAAFPDWTIDTAQASSSPSPTAEPSAAPSP